MGKFSLSGVVATVRNFTEKHQPEILAGIGIGGMITAVGLTVPATIKAVRLVDEKKKELEVEKLTPAETVKTVWKCYIPAAVTTVASTACLIGSTASSARRNTALAAAYKLSENALAEYRDKVIETIGEEQEKVVREKVAEEKLKNAPAVTNDVIMTDHGDTLCYDAFAGRYFVSSRETIIEAMNIINFNLNAYSYQSINDFYDELNLEHSDIGDDLGWNIDKGLVKVDFGSKIASNGKPCLVLMFSVEPRRNFNRFA